jgi:hypothetical protein
MNIAHKEEGKKEDLLQKQILPSFFRHQEKPIGILT